MPKTWIRVDPAAVHRNRTTGADDPCVVIVSEEGKRRCVHSAYIDGPSVLKRTDDIAPFIGATVAIETEAEVYATW